ncbi:hypothetical protein AVEN_183972-1 [Araneus ventricosus]|uniref:Uncharacterized protein n=1 Tax=Araneus ventricosus TaxID=182803 RepID=A0A4Y2E3C8_ARAVE|nr:hypothetical protein AVEN_183972-1 [Araneus ventricosus]
MNITTFRYSDKFCGRYCNIEHSFIVYIGYTCTASDPLPYFSSRWVFLDSEIWAFTDTKMSFLKRKRKEDLISSATDLGENSAPTFSKVDLVSLIQGNKRYNEDDAKLMLETVVTEREERFKLQAEQKKRSRND